MPAHPAQFGARAYGHVHSEAFMLMQYECAPPRSTPFGPGTPRPHCGTVEVIWNSRDGVTPFVVGCRNCGGEMTHARWHEDRYAPDHTPAPGDRVFVDLTPEAAREGARRNAERFWNDATYPASQTGRWATVEEMADELARGYLEGVPGSPDIIEWPEPEPPTPRGHYCVVHGREHPEGFFDECVSEADAVIQREWVEQAIEPKPEPVRLRWWHWLLPGLRR